MTFLRFTTDDQRGILKAYVGEGEFRAEALPTKAAWPTAILRISRD